MSFILCKTKPSILKNCGWQYIDDYESMISLKIEYMFYFNYPQQFFLVFKCAFDH